MEQYRTFNQLLLDCELKCQTILAQSTVIKEKTKLIQAVERLFEKTMGFSVSALEPTNQFLISSQENDSPKLNPAL